MLTEKLCPKCGDIKKIAMFSKSKATKTGYQSWCKGCLKVPIKAWAQKNVSKVNWLARYGLSAEGYNDLFEKQEGCCRICKRHQSEFKKRLYVDHCHKTNKIRGLLCDVCNRGLGYFKDRVDLLQTAITYLEDSYEC